MCLHPVAHRALKVAESEDHGQLFYLTLKNLPAQEEASMNIILFGFVLVDGEIYVMHHS